MSTQDQSLSEQWRRSEEALKERLTAEDWEVLQRFVNRTHPYNYGSQDEHKVLSFFVKIGYLDYHDAGPGGSYYIYELTPRGKRAWIEYKARH